MSRKLQQMDQLVWDLAERMPSDAILFVIGDHGMTSTGDHGGDSTDERTSAIFAYSKKVGAFLESEAPKMNPVCPNQAKMDSSKRVFYQVDLVPTLALLLDVPIPYSNIGSVMDPILSGDSLQREIRLNYFQMLRYAQEYARHKPELKDQLHQIIRQYESSPDDYESTRQTTFALRSLIRHSLERQFQWTICFLGLLSLLDAIVFNCYLLTTGTDEWLSIYLWIFRSALLLLQLSLVFAEQHGIDQILFSTGSLAVSLCYQLPVLIAKLLSLSRRHFQPSLLVVIAGQLFLSMLSFSNSYIIYEADVLRYAIQSFVLITAARLVQRITSPSLGHLAFSRDLHNILSFTFFILVFMRIFKLFETCREEQVECISYKHTDGQLFLICIIMSFASAYLLTVQFWPASLLTKGFVWPMTVFLCTHWLFELSIHSIQGRQTEQQQATTTIAILESCSRMLALLIFASLIAHHLLLRWLNNARQSKESQSGLFESQYQVLSVPLMMLIGPTHGWSMAAALAMFPMAEQLFRLEKVWTFSWLLHLLSAYIFYATGNQATLSSIPWRAAFVGLPGNFPYKWLPGMFILISMFAGRVLAALMVQRVRSVGECGTGTEQAPLYLLFFGALKVFGCSAASLLHYQHLMFYKVFAPMFVFQGVEFLFSCAFVVFWSYLLNNGIHMPHSNKVL